MLNARSTNGAVRWQQAYALTLSVCCAYSAVALMVFGFGIRSTAINGGLALCFSVSLLFCCFRMVTSRGSLAALPYFLIGCALFYGMGTFVATLLPETMYKISFTSDVQRVMLAQVNAINIVAISTVVFVAAPICMNVGSHNVSERSEFGLHDVIAKLERLLPLLLLISIPVLALMWATFPRTQNLLLLSLLKLLSGVPLFTVLLGGAVWTRLDGGKRGLILLLVLGLALYGFLGLRKLYTILPMLSFLIGLWVVPRSRPVAGIIGLVIVAAYFGGLADVMNYGRLHASFDPLKNTPFDRIDIVRDTMASAEEMAGQHYRGTLAQRFSIAPFEAHFIALYDSGAPGDSLKHIFDVLIPRILWPDKPLIAPGSEFDTIFRGYIAQSSLAIGFIAEAYWNLGWLGVLLISAMIGLEIGWFTRRWHLFCQEGWSYSGIFFMGPLVLQQSLWVETNIVGGYVGGMVKLMLFVLAVDIAMRVYMTRRRNSEMLRPSNYMTRSSG